MRNDGARAAALGNGPEGSGGRAVIVLLSSIVSVTSGAVDCHCPAGRSPGLIGSTVTREGLSTAKQDC